MEPISLPSEFVMKMKSLMGGEWEDFAASYHQESFQALRFQPLKRGLEKEEYASLLSRLGIAGAEPVPWAEDAFYYKEPAYPGKHPYHEMGLYYIQEPSAMSAAGLLGARPGERVLDLCAAPGGKTTQLAAAMRGEGLLVANEPHAKRCAVLSQNVERMGIANAIVTNETCERLAARFPAYFDKILVDAPCSGEGMFRKNPEAAAQWNPELVQMCADRQRLILSQAAGMLRPGGRLVYSTCTFSPEENEGVIASFLSEHEEFELESPNAPYFDRGRPQWGDGDERLSGTCRLFPHHLRGEGHFAAVLHKKGKNSLQEGRGTSKGAKTVSRRRTNAPAKDEGALADSAMRRQLQEFCVRTLTEEAEGFLLSGRLVLFGGWLYRLVPDAPSLDGLRVLRAGLQVGAFKKNRFEPSHALALWLGRDDVKNRVLLKCGSAQAAAYFRGEAFEAEGRDGFCLVCIDGFGAGWGKLVSGRLKNHYPKGLRR